MLTFLIIKGMPPYYKNTEKYEDTWHTTILRILIVLAGQDCVAVYFCTHSTG